MAEAKKQEIVQARFQPPSIETVTDEATLKELEGVVGAGLSDSTEDRGTPLIYLAQKGSPQIDERDAKYLPGLKIGMAFNNLTGEMYDAEEEGLPFLPCFMRMTWDEWTPRIEGGGFHGSHPRNFDMEKAGAKPFVKKNGKERRDIFVLPDGHELKLTAKYYGVIPTTWSPVIIPMASTSLGAATRLQAIIAAQKIKVGEKIVPKPAFWTNYVLKSVYETNDDGTWFQWSVGELQGKNENKELREFCKAFALACERNEVKMSEPVAESGGAPKDGDVPI
jgi:hypothetical protein